MDEGDDSSLGDGDALQNLVQLLVILDGQQKVAGDDPQLLVVPGSVPSQLEDLGSEVLHDSCEVDRSATSHPGGVVSLPQQAVDPSNRELQAGPGTSGLLASLGLALGLLER